MKRSERKGLKLALVMLLGVGGKTVAAPPLNIYSVNYPLQYFAERIAGSHAKVVFPAPADIDPAYWVPEPAVVNDFQGADLILLNGAGYARWVNKAALPRSRLVDTSAVFKADYLAAETATSHSHGPGGEHSHSGVAFTTWLDFALAARQAEAIRDAITRLRPDLREVIETNYGVLERELMELDQRAEAIGLHAKGKPMVASHPVYQYLALAYGLNLLSVHWEFDQVPGDDNWREMEALLGRHQAEIMLWEGEPQVPTVQRLLSTGLESVLFNPAANRPAKGDWLSVMRANLDRLENAALR